MFYFRPRLSNFGSREDGAIDQDGFRADDETDSEEGTSSHPKPSMIEAPGNHIFNVLLFLAARTTGQCDCCAILVSRIKHMSHHMYYLTENASAASNSQMEEPYIERRGVHQGPHQVCQQRRFSQDRSAHKIQHSR